MPCIFHVQLILSTHNIQSTDYCYVSYLYYFLLFLLVDDEVVECIEVVITGQIACSLSFFSA